MTDYSELKRLVDRVLTDRRFCGDENHKALADGVLALIGENQRLERLALDSVNAEYAANMNLESICVERDQLKAENEALRKDRDIALLALGVSLEEWSKSDAAMGKGEQS